MYYVLEDKKTIQVHDIIEWGKWMNDANRTIKKTKLHEGVEVSTVFLGVDHAFRRGKPILFETMIFGGEHDEYQERYCTYEEAEAGHKRAVELVFSV